MKKIVIILVLAILLILICGAIWKNNEDIINPNNQDVLKERFEIIEQTLINKDSSIAQIERINNKYIMIKMLQVVPLDDMQYTENKENIFLFDLENNKFLNENVSLDGDSQFVGVTTSSIYMFLVKRSSPKLDLVEISYPDLKITNTISLDNIKDIGNIVVSRNSNKLAYSTTDGLFVCDKDLTNPQLLLKSNKNEIEDIMDLKISVPLEFVDNDTKIIYKEIGYEWSNGIGIIDINTGTNNFYEKSDTELLKYVEPNNIYTKDVYTGVPVNKYILSTKNEENILNIEDTRCVAINMSEKNDKIVFVKEIIEQEKTSVEYNVYDINTKQIISTYLEELIDYNNVIDIQFINQDKQILIIKSNEMKIWNYDIK